MRTFKRRSYSIHVSSLDAGDRSSGLPKGDSLTAVVTKSVGDHIR